MQKLSENFKEFLEHFRAGKYKTPLEIPPNVWMDTSWDYLSPNTLEEIFLPLINHNIKRAMHSMPGLYQKAYESKKITRIESLSEFVNIPILVKDSAVHGVGFREKVAKNPYVMMPTDCSSTYVYKSGGTRGVATPTFITPKDREIEAYGLARCFKHMGFKEKTVALSMYNPTHKGGELIKEACEKLGFIYIPKRTTDNAEDIINTIQDYKVNALMTVQGPLSEGDRVHKGGGLDFVSLVEQGQDVLEKNLENLFITGYTLIPEVISWAENFNKKLTTTLGSSEAIPQATSTNYGHSNYCHHNNQHIVYGPHYTEVVKHESGVMVPVKTGEEGILAYTTIAREGTIYLRYSPGDGAKITKDQGSCSCGITSKIITDVGRIDIPEETIQTGCCIG
jgi:phenylacetate-coenzyme A ligase PaaK-like adenylate-forming protein